LSATNDSSGRNILLTIGQYGFPIIGGAIFALILYKLWSLPTRFLIAISIGMILVSVSAFFIKRLSDFLLVAFFFSIPFTAFIKSLFFLSQGYDERMLGILLYSGVIGVGLPDIILWALYATWFARIFITHQSPLPSLEKNDYLALLLVLAYALSIPGTSDATASIFALGYLLRFVLAYFYVSRNFDARHIKWLFIAFFTIIFFESALALFQFGTGKLIGLAMDRGAGVRLDQQYAVPGIEHRNRATGTSYESHTFGLIMTMMVQYAFVMMASYSQRGIYRLAATVAFALAMIAILVSFSRSAWMSCGIALLVSWGTHIFVWRERRIIVPSMFVGMSMLLLSPWILQIIVERFATAGGDLLQARFDQYPVAWDIWTDHFLFGYGVGNYMDALETYNMEGVIELPVHNTFLWLGAETGLLGVIAFFGLALAAMSRMWKIVKLGRDPISRLALAVFCSLLAYLLDGLTNPLYREPGIYMMFWMAIAISLAVVRINRQETAAADG